MWCLLCNPVIFLTCHPSAHLWACITSDMCFTYQGICDSSLEGTKFSVPHILLLQNVWIGTWLLDLWMPETVKHVQTFPPSCIQYVKQSGNTDGRVNIQCKGSMLVMFCSYERFLWSELYWITSWNDPFISLAMLTHTESALSSVYWTARWTNLKALLLRMTVKCTELWSEWTREGCRLLRKWKAIVNFARQRQTQGWCS